MQVKDVHNAKIIGSGERVFVLAHGVGGNKEQMGPLAELLSTHGRVVTFDLAGFGAYHMSEYSSLTHTTLYGYADDLVSLLDDLHLSEVIYVGHSLSGMAGILAALGREDLISKVVTIGASPCYIDQPEEQYRGGMSQRELEDLFAVIERDYAVWAAGFAQAMMMSDPQSTAVTSFAESLAGANPDVTIAALRAAFSSDFRNEIKTFTKPTLVINSTEDLAVPKEAAEWLAHNLSNAKLEIVDVPGHFPHVLAPELIADLVSNFVL